MNTIIKGTGNRLSLEQGLMEQSGQVGSRSSKATRSLRGYNADTAVLIRPGGDADDQIPYPS